MCTGEVYPFGGKPRKSEVITVSGKEINELIQTGEFAKIDPSAEPIKEPELPEDVREASEPDPDDQPEDQNDDRNKRKKMLIKFGAMGALAVVALIFATI